MSKTTTTVNLGIGLARAGNRVLLIDSDPQASLTASMGEREPDRLDKTLATVLTSINKVEKKMKADPAYAGKGCGSFRQTLTLRQWKCR